MKVLICGAGGQLGRTLCQRAPVDAELMALTSAQLDVTDRQAVFDAIDRIEPQIVINAAAYTAVDRAENEPDRANAINNEAVRHLADATAGLAIRLVHVSSDFVFGGSLARPLRTCDMSDPVGVYGQTKRAGELAALVNSKALVVRTSWVYAAFGANFVLTMLRLMRERSALSVVADQIGSPTWAGDLADALWALAPGTLNGLAHYSDSGVASWYDFAVAIMEEAVALDLLAGEIPISPISTSEYPTPAARPAYSVLDCKQTYDALGATAPHWRKSLRAMLRELKANG